MKIQILLMVPLLFFLILFAGMLAVTLITRIDDWLDTFPRLKDDPVDEIGASFTPDYIRKELKRIHKFYGKDVAESLAAAISTDDIFRTSVFDADFLNLGQETADAKVRGGAAEESESDEDGI
ncbi:MAG: hypothetical protein LBG57_09635 [Treponema sp.]|jgi:hypothetical protein|nr:hypothetical protein [Treponema sp.]